MFAKLYYTWVTAEDRPWAGMIKVQTGGWVSAGETSGSLKGMQVSKVVTQSWGMGSVCLSRDCCNKLTQTGWLKTIEIYSLLDVEARSPKSVSLSQSQGAAQLMTRSTAKSGHLLFPGFCCNLLRRCPLFVFCPAWDQKQNPCRNQPGIRQKEQGIPTRGENWLSSNWW